MAVEGQDVSVSSAHLRAALQCKAPLSEDELARFRARWRDEMDRGGGRTVVLEPGVRVDLLRSGIGRLPVVRPPPLAWYYVCDPMILLAVIAGAVMVPIALLIVVTG
jgi:hypothetical protein